jgi:hypothetical protein
MVISSLMIPTEAYSTSPFSVKVDATSLLGGLAMEVRCFAE